MTDKPNVRVSDVATDSGQLDGEQVQVRDLVNREFTITKIAEYTNKDGPYLAVQIEGQRGKFFFFTSHKVIYHKLSQCIGHEPLLAVIRKREPERGGQPYFDVE